MINPDSGISGCHVNTFSLSKTPAEENVWAQPDTTELFVWSLLIRNLLFGVTRLL